MNGMNEQTGTPAASQPTATSGAPGNGGSAAASASANPATQSIDYDALATALAPKVIEGLEAKQTAKANAAAAAARKGQQPNQNQGQQDSGAGAPEASNEDLSALTKEQLIARFRAQGERSSMFERRLQAIEAENEQRVAAQKRQSAEQALDALITSGGYANADLMRMAIAPYVKEGSRPGEYLYDDGRAPKPLADAVLALGARAEFKAANGGRGAGAQANSQTTQAGGAQGQTAAVDAMQMDRAGFAAFKANLEAAHGGTIQVR